MNDFILYAYDGKELFLFFIEKRGFFMTISPHGGQLVYSKDSSILIEPTLPEIEMDAFTLANLECLANGAYSPLKGFMTRKDYLSVLNDFCLDNGLIWTIPVTLPIDKELKTSLSKVGKAKLVFQNNVYGLIDIMDIYEVNSDLEAKLIFGTKDENHPGVSRLYKNSNVYVGGNITMSKHPIRSVAENLYLDPIETRQAFRDKGWSTIVAFQTRNPIHRAHEYIQKTALEIVDGLLIHPLVGHTKQGDIPPSTRIKSYETVLENYYSHKHTMLSVFPAPMHYAGPREAVHHAIVRKNYGCTHFIVGRDHAGVGNYYGTYDAQKIFDLFSKEELEIVPLFFENSFYCAKCGNMATVKTCPHDERERVILSGTKVREMLSKGERPPITFSRQEVINVLLADMKIGGKKET